MKQTKQPLRFDVASILKLVRRLPVDLEGVSIQFPFVSIDVKPNDVEKRVAREIVIRMADRRVLNAYECCDGCIDRALESLQKIRSLLVDKQVDLAAHSDSSLYLLIEFMLEGIRQFLTFEQRLNRTQQNQQKYFEGLELLRGHLYRSLSQMALIADMEVPKISEAMRYKLDWQTDAYIDAELPVKRDDV